MPVADRPIRYEYADLTADVGEYRFRHTGYRYDRGRVYRYGKPVYAAGVIPPPDKDAGLLLWDCYYNGSNYRSPDGLFTLNNGEHVGKVIATNGNHNSLGGDYVTAVNANSNIPYGNLRVPDCKFKLGPTITIPQIGFYGFDYAVIENGFTTIGSYNYRSSVRGGGIKVRLADRVDLIVEDETPGVSSGTVTEFSYMLTQEFKSATDRTTSVYLAKNTSLKVCLDKVSHKNIYLTYRVEIISRNMKLRNVKTNNNFPIILRIGTEANVGLLKCIMGADIDMTNSYGGRVIYDIITANSSYEYSIEKNCNGNMRLSGGEEGTPGYGGYGYNAIIVSSPLNRNFNLTMSFDNSQVYGNYYSKLDIVSNFTNTGNVNVNLTVPKKTGSLPEDHSLLANNIGGNVNINARCMSFTSTINLDNVTVHANSSHRVSLEGLKLNPNRRGNLTITTNSSTGSAGVRSLDLRNFTGSSVTLNNITGNGLPITINGNKSITLNEIYTESYGEVILDTSEHTGSSCTINKIKLLRSDDNSVTKLDYMVRGPNDSSSYIDRVEFKFKTKIRGCPKFYPSSDYSIKVYGARLIDGTPTFKHRCTVKDVFLITDSASVEDDAIVGGNFKLAGTAIVGGRMNINVKPPIVESPESNRDAAAFSLYFGEYRYDWVITEAFQLGNVIDPYGNIIYFYRKNESQLYIIVNNRSISFQKLAATLLQEIGDYKERESQVSDPTTNSELIRKREEIRKLAIAYKLAESFLLPFCKTKGFDLTTFDIEPVALFKC